MAGRKLILGIESSCDETAAAVVADGAAVLSNVIASQHDLHAEYRGVVPEIASRAHAERILPVVQRAAESAGIGLHDIDAVAVGNRPGLIGSLLVGVSAAKALAWSLGVPVIGVDHIRAHLYAGLLDRDGNPDELSRTYPALGLVVSGGHTSLFWCGSPIEASVIGRTIDDAIGEAYDKVATILDVPYPGGPNLDRLAQRGDPHAHDLPISRLSPESLDFSFSGLKTAVLYIVQGVPETGRKRQHAPDRAGIDLNDDAARADVAASFQRAAVGAVVLKVERALDQYASRGAETVRTLLVGGGVSANSLLRAELARIGRERGIDVRLPRMDLCLDNAAMIAGLGHHLLQADGWTGDALSLSASPSSR